MRKKQKRSFTSFMKEKGHFVLIGAVVLASFTTSSYLKNDGLILDRQFVAAVASANPTGGCTYPAQILNLTNWKVTLPTGAEGTPTEIKQPSLATFVSNPFFRVNSGCNGVVFRSPVTGATTQNSNYPRSELREMTSNGTANASWDPASGTHIMFIDEAITAVPATKKHVVAGQIHGGSDDVVVIRLEYPKLFVDINGNEGPILDSNYTLGKRFTVKFVAGGSKIDIFYNGASTPSHTMKRTGSGHYFKAGAYTQSNCDRETSCTDSNYGEVTIYNLWVSHDGSTPPPYATPAPLPYQTPYASPYATPTPSPYATPSSTGKSYQCPQYEKRGSCMDTCNGQTQGEPTCRRDWIKDGACVFDDHECTPVSSTPSYGTPYSTPYETPYSTPTSAAKYLCPQYEQRGSCIDTCNGQTQADSVCRRDWISNGQCIFDDHECTEIAGGGISTPVSAVGFEAELGTITAPMKVVSEAGVSGGEYIVQTDRSGTGGASYTFSVPQTGTYILRARVLTPSGSENSVYYSLDGKSSVALHFPDDLSSWTWTDGPRVKLTQGSHTFAIGHRERNTKIDAFEFVYVGK